VRLSTINCIQISDYTRKTRKEVDQSCLCMSPSTRNSDMWTVWTDHYCHPLTLSHGVKLRPVHRIHVVDKLFNASWTCSIFKPSRKKKTWIFRIFFRRSAQFRYRALSAKQCNDSSNKEHYKWKPASPSHAPHLVEAVYLASKNIIVIIVIIKHI